MSTSYTARIFLLGSLALAAMGGCSLGTEGQLETFAGEWCTLHGLGSGGLPRTSDRYVGIVLLQEGDLLLGSGSTKRTGSDVIFQSRFRGTFTGNVALLDVSDLDAEADVKGPVFTLELRLAGSRDLNGTISGDPGLDGPITLVRLGPRCFFE